MKKKAAKKKTLSKKEGRPTKLTPELQEKICRALAGGNYRSVVAAHARIGEATLYRWIEQGKKDEAAGIDSEFREFREAIRQAEAEWEIGCASSITRAAFKGDWRAGLAILERKSRNRWGRRDSLEQVTRDITEDLKTLPRHQLEEFERLLLRGIAPDRALARCRKS